MILMTVLVPPLLSAAVLPVFPSMPAKGVPSLFPGWHKGSKAYIWTHYAFSEVETQKQQDLGASCLSTGGCSPRCPSNSPPTEGIQLLSCVLLAGRIQHCFLQPWLQVDLLGLACFLSSPCDNYILHPCWIINLLAISGLFSVPSQHPDRVKHLGYRCRPVFVH